jgi:preprotein translocase subunit SecG
LNQIVSILKRIVVVLLTVFIVVVFGLFAFNFYRRSTVGNEPDAKPPVIYERSDRPSRA